VWLLKRNASIAAGAVFLITPNHDESWATGSVHAACMQSAGAACRHSADVCEQLFSAHVHQCRWCWAASGLLFVHFSRMHVSSQHLYIYLRHFWRESFICHPLSVCLLKCCGWMLMKFENRSTSWNREELIKFQNWSGTYSGCCGNCKFISWSAVITTVIKAIWWSNILFQILV